METVCKLHETQYRQAFRKLGQKVTPARLAILEVLEHTNKPFSAEEVKVALADKKVDLATIYRNLELFKANGWVFSVNLDSQISYYELTKRGHHHHLVCEACGQIAELADCRVRVISKHFFRKKGFAKITRHNLEYFGLCQKCVIKKH